MVTVGGKPRRIAVPVEMPEGVSYEGVFGDEAEAPAAPSATLHFAAIASKSSVPSSGSGSSRNSGGMSGGIVAKSKRAGLAEKPAQSTASPSVLGNVSLGKEEAKLDVSVAEDRDGYSATPSESAEQKLERKAAAKLDSTLSDLLAKYAKDGKSGKYSIANKLEVTDGSVEVLIWVSNPTSETVAQLKALGLLDAQWVLKDKVLIGKIDIAKLLKLAEEKQVLRIAPPIYLKK